MDAVFRAIADPARRVLLGELAQRNDQTLFELCARLVSIHGLSMSRQAVSKHLSVLAEAGLIELTSQGRTTIHHLDPAALDSVRGWIDHITGES